MKTKQIRIKKNLRTNLDDLRAIRGEVVEARITPEGWAVVLDDVHLFNSEWEEVKP